MTLRLRRPTPVLVTALLVLGALTGGPEAVFAQRTSDTFTELGFDFGGGAAFSAGAQSGTAAEVVASINLLKLSDGGPYRSYGAEIFYGGHDAQELFGIMPRVEVGLREVDFGSGDYGDAVSVYAPYLSLAAGYASGTVWDAEYIDLYGSVEDIEVSVTGIPVFASMGIRRIGGFNLRLEVVGGVVLVTSQESERPEGESPSVIPSIGARIAFGIDTFTYAWR